MTDFHVPTQNRRRFGLVALVLVVALVLPSLAWADHGSDHPYSQFDDPALISAEEHFAALVEKYESGELVYHAPGRRDDTKFSSSASDHYAALLAKYESGELVYHAPGRRDDTSFGSSASDAFSADSARMAALGATYAGAGAASQTDNADSARMVALGATYAAASAASQTDNADSARWAALGATFASQTDNPELAQFWRFAGQGGCSVPEVQC